MARPRKCTVDYFPHDCQHKQTMFIVENRHGNDGYAFWFKLLELLGSTEGHFIDCRNEVTREFLQAKTRLDWNLCGELLDLLAKLGAIDSDLWKIQVVWSDNFLSRIKDVYGNRKVEIPTKPGFYEQKPIETIVSTADNPQSKLKETKGKKKNSYSDDFEKFWKNYPSKTAKPMAEKSFKKALEKTTIEIIMKSLKEYCESEKVKNKVICNPSTWLNQERWSDEQIQEQEPVDNYTVSNAQMEIIMAVENKIYERNLASGNNKKGA